MTYCGDGGIFSGGIEAGPQELVPPKPHAHLTRGIDKMKRLFLLARLGDDDRASEALDMYRILRDGGEGWPRSVCRKLVSEYILILRMGS